MKPYFAIRWAIYSLDPNRHLAHGVAFEDYLVTLAVRSVTGLPVPEENVQLFQRHVECESRVSSYGLPTLNPSWRTLADQIAALVQDISTSPLPSTLDDEEIWRRKIFTFPPGRYAILRPGPELASIVETAPPASDLRAWAEFHQESSNPFDEILARGFREARESPPNISAIDDFWSPRREFHRAVGNKDLPTVRAILASGLSLNDDDRFGVTAVSELIKEAKIPADIAQLINDAFIAGHLKINHPCSLKSAPPRAKLEEN